MKHEIIKTENYLLVVDDLQAKEGDWGYIPFQGGSVKLVGRYFADDWKKIIAHIPLNNSPILEFVDLLPPLKDDVDKLAKEYFNNITPSDSPYQNGLYIGFKAGYNKAKENDKPIPDWVYSRLCVYDKRNPDYLPYDEDDLTKKPTNCICDNCFYGRTKIADFVMQQFKKELPIAFTSQLNSLYKTIGSIKGRYGSGVKVANERACLPMTTTNSKGQTVWVGEYKYDSLKELKIINQEDNYTEQKFYDLLPDICLIEDTTNENTNNQRCMGFNACKKCFNNARNSVIIKNE